MKWYVIRERERERERERKREREREREREKEREKQRLLHPLSLSPNTQIPLNTPVPAHRCP